MNRLHSHLAELHKKNEKALILFVTAGDPDPETTAKIMRALAEHGADCIELGIPFSDPIADGPVIQRSARRALCHDSGIEQGLKLLRDFRRGHETPMVLMGYFNPILRYGPARFVKALKKSGGDGVIVADLPYEEGEHFERITRENGICLIYMLAPEVGTDRTKKILAASSGFVYCVSHYGTTGQDCKDRHSLEAVVRSLRPLTTLPIAIGFGISSLEQARSMSRIADGIIIGSWLIRELEQAADKEKAAAQFAGKVKRAISPGHP